jgi:hypothetical protein
MAPNCATLIKPRSAQKIQVARNQTRLPLRVKLRNTQPEQMCSALPPRMDIGLAAVIHCGTLPKNSKAILSCPSGHPTGRPKRRAAALRATRSIVFRSGKNLLHDHRQVNVQKQTYERPVFHNIRLTKFCWQMSAVGERSGHWLKQRCPKSACQ